MVDHPHAMRPASPVPTAGIVALLVLPTLLVGAATPGLQAWAVGAAAVVVAAFALDSARRRAVVTADPLALVLLGLAAFTLLQAAPIGLELCRTLGGPVVDRAAAATAGIATPWWSISVEPASSVFEALKLLAWGGLFLAVATLSRREERATLFLLAVGVAGLAEVAVGVVNVVAGPSDLFGLYVSPLTERPGFQTTLLNHNHAAALLNLAAFAWLGLALDPNRSRWRPACAVGFLATLAGSVATFSRGGAGALVLALVAFAAWYRLLRRDARVEPMRPAVQALFLALLLAGAVIFLLGVEHAVNLVAGKTLLPAGWGAKTGSWRPALQLIADHWPAGVGRGGVASAVTAYNETMPDYTLAYFENVALQALADWGVPVGAAALLGVSALVVRLLASVSAWPTGLAAGFGVVAVGLQNLFDFSLEIPGVAIPVIGVLGVLAGQSAAEREDAEPGPRPIPRRLLAILALVALAATVATLPWTARHERGAAEDRGKDLVTRARAGEAVGPELDAQLASDLRLHPADAHLLLLGARTSDALGRADRAADLAHRALILFPASWEAGLLLAQRVSDLGRPEQAVGPLRTLLADHPKRHAELWPALVRMNLADDLAIAVFAGDPAARQEWVQWLTERHLDGRLERFLTAALKQEPTDADLLAQLAGLEFLSARVEAAERLATRLLATHPEREWGWRILGRIYANRQWQLEALSMVEEAAKRAADPSEDLVEELRLLAALGRWPEFDALEPGTSARVAGNRFWSARVAQLQAERELAADRFDRAMAEFDRAALKLPTDPAIPLRKARLLKEHHRFQEAADAYRAALRIQPTDADAARELEEAVHAATAPGWPKL